MIQFQLTNSSVFVSHSGYKGEVDYLKTLLSITIHYYTKTRGAAHPTLQQKTICYYDEDLRSFPAGLLPRVWKELKLANIQVSISDSRQKPSSLVKQHFKLDLPPSPVTEADYSFQEEAVSIAINRGRGLLWYPTGAGKTVIIAKIIDTLKLRSLVVVPNTELLNQTYRKFQDYFTPNKVGVFGDGKRDLKKPIIIATQQSLYSMLKRDRGEFEDEVGSKFDVLFVDECHHVATGSPWVFNKKEKKWEMKENIANSWWDVAMNIHSYYRFGMSATLNTKESPNNQFVLESVTGSVIASITVSELIQRKVLCPIKVTMITLIHQRYRAWRSTYQKDDDGEYLLDSTGERIVDEPGAYEFNITQNSKRNQLIADVALGWWRQGKRVLVQLDLVETHGKILADMIPGCVFLHGSLNRKERDAGLARVRETGCPLIGTIFKEGFDMPEIDAMIIASGGTSSKAIIQKIGRVLRVSPGKIQSEILDFYDADEESMCQRHSESRLEVYSSEPMYEVHVIGAGEQYAA